MNILTVLTAYPPAIGGAQLHTHQIMRRLAERHRVQVISMWDTHRTDWLLGTTLQAPLYPRCYVQDSIPVRQITLSLAQRLVIWPWVLGYYAIKRAAIKRIATLLAPQIDAAMPDADIVHCARIGREPLAFAALQVARMRGIPFVLAPYHHPRWVGWNYQPLHELYRAADAVLTLTEVERQQLVELGVERKRIAVVGAAATVESHADGVSFRTRHGLKDEPIILFLGQKRPYKGWQLLLKAAPQVWSSFPNARFFFIGPRTRLSERLFAQHTDQRIVEISEVSEQEKTDALAACTLFCLPSSQESFGMVYAEAWEQGRPVIGLDIPALHEVISDGVDGYLSPPQDSAALAGYIIELLGDERKREAMGEAGRTKARSRFSWEHVATAVESMYRTLL